MGMAMHFTLRMSLNCTFCNRSLNKPQDAADDEDVRTQDIACRTNSPHLNDKAVRCPKCHQITHNKKVVAKLNRQHLKQERMSVQLPLNNLP
jgi:DNA-directed RNA polymerase subunit RPC12/RpoP